MIEVFNVQNNVILAVFDANTLEGADLKGVNFAYANLRGANLKHANLTMASLAGADLKLADLRGTNLKGVDLEGADLTNAKLDREDVPRVKDLDQKLEEATRKSGSLNMTYWHDRDGVHCRAGWVVTIAGKAGLALEHSLGTCAAAALIYVASGRTIVPNFHADDLDARADIVRCANIKNKFAFAKS
jgi:hypothetical protein